MEQNKKLKWERIKQAIKQLMTWKMLISLAIAWLIFAGWAVAFIIIGIFANNAWFYGVGTAFIGWVILPNGTFMIPLTMSIPIHKLLFGKKPNINIKGEIK